jgi:hypothetical protein
MNRKENFGKMLTDLLPCVHHLKGDPLHKSNFKYTTLQIILYRMVTAFILVLNELSDIDLLSITKDVIG